MPKIKFLAFCCCMLLFSAAGHATWGGAEVCGYGSRHFSPTGICTLHGPVIGHTLPGGDWIKVRYMGGGGCYDAVATVLVNTTARFPETRQGGSYVSFILSDRYFLFKLRGPPFSL